ncbi:UDP-N-acetylmuramoyl-L-alanyl-D-glutamate--2,6-diaminopimelate ligase [Paenibacillus nanensis]|uniref:UDP-N-acetylmuramyl-tripeptide synthetase n=1 Tax=Paenibacillus nanensis TaxID=393251 RepID=A0A3A1URU4_9BACL|nr:UDP-N-acetylmuramoyl-L-alanyl-D-glutamate--2,6-diaminopimelate ligase [Paenibacillus nanensis]RIX45832.1 UDP-N-acetylmuramoyl-L-alanyl-D-glutamate--2,6-diaminopimelate ligase [Paenibacillus nanensis]
MNPNSAPRTIRILSTDVEVTGIQFHSGKVKQGEIFVAIPGMKSDGHDFIEQAIESGAAAIVGEKPFSGLPVPYFQVTDAREALAQLTAQYYDHPSRRHIMIGITGTNGKTTTAYLLKHIIECSGLRCSLIGSVVNSINGHDIPSLQTTPDVLQLQKWLAESQDEVVVMEVSSHGIHQKRILGITFDYVIFTNLSHDHLDYHGSIDTYYLTKQQLFDHLKPQGEAVISSLGFWGQRLLDHLLSTNKKVKTFGGSENNDLHIAPAYSASTEEFRFCDGTHTATIKIPLPGTYNAWNVGAAWLTGLQLGIRSERIQQALSSFPGAPGRFEMIPHPIGAKFIIDYAHTPDGFEQFLKTLHGQKESRIVHIFGFRGNGDPSKRRIMLDISVVWSDEVILTLDNLGGRDKESMLLELQEMIQRTGASKCKLIEDRTKAIEYAWLHAREGDQIAITGKGRENYDQSFELPSRTDPETLDYLLQYQFHV